MQKTPNYIKALLMPNGRKPAGRRVWSIDLETVWLPFFSATNVMGDTAIPVEALGAPLRLAYAQDGSVKFNKSGRPVTKVVKEIADSVRLVKENFTANLTNYANAVIADRADDYKALVKSAIKAGEPILAHDRNELDKAIKAQIEAMAETVPQSETEPSPETVPQSETEPTHSPELVTA